MLNIEAKTRLEPQEVAKRLKDYFASKGEGLKLDQEDETCLSFHGPHWIRRDQYQPHG